MHAGGFVGKGQDRERELSDRLRRVRLALLECELHRLHEELRRCQLENGFIYQENRRLDAEFKALYPKGQPIVP
jgi:hypothetical protein